MEGEVRAELDAIGGLMAQRAFDAAEGRLEQLYGVLRALEAEGSAPWIDRALSVALERKALFAQMRHDGAGAAGHLEEAQRYVPQSASVALNMAAVLHNTDGVSGETVLAASKHAVRCLEGAPDDAVPNRVNLLALAYFYYSQAIEGLVRTQYRAIEHGRGLPEDKASLENRVHSVTLTFANSHEFSRTATDPAVAAMIQGGCQQWSQWLARARLPFRTHDPARPHGELWDAQVAYAQYFDALPGEASSRAGSSSGGVTSDERESSGYHQSPEVGEAGREDYKYADLDEGAASAYTDAGGGWDLDAIEESDSLPTTRYRPIRDLLRQAPTHLTPMPSPGAGYFADVRSPPTEPQYSLASGYSPATQYSYGTPTRQQPPTPASVYHRVGTPMGPVHLPLPFGSPAVPNPAMAASPRAAQPFRGVDRVAVTMPQTTQEGALSSQNHSLLGQRLQGHRAMPSFVSKKEYEAEEAKRAEAAQRKADVARARERQRARGELRSYGRSASTHRDPAALDDSASEDSEVETEPDVPEIFQKLVDKAKLQEQKLESMREAAIKREMAEMKSKPTITKKAQQKTFRHTLAERAKMKVDQRKADMEAAAQAAAVAEEAELEALTFKPKITKRGQIARGKAQAMAESDRARSAKKVKSAMHDEQLEELAECSFQPQINARSERLALKAKARQGDNAGGPHYTHADSLMDRSQAARLKNFAKSQAEAAKTQHHTPCISRFAANAAEVNPKLRDQSAFDRLYTPPRLPPQPAAAPFGPPYGWRQDEDLLVPKYSPRSSFQM